MSAILGQYYWSFGKRRSPMDASINFGGSATQSERRFSVQLNGQLRAHRLEPVYPGHLEDEVR